MADINENFDNLNTDKLETSAYVPATTAVLGKAKMSVAPADAANPIAVWDNDPRVPTTAQVGYIPTSDQKNALAGTSGTPSTSNKYVTNDDTATAATANKLARRLAGGNITVVTETTWNNTTNAASTAFVQQELTANIPTLNYTVNTNTEISSYYTWQVPMLASTTSVLLGWSSSGLSALVVASNPSAGGVMDIWPNSGAGYISTLLPWVGSTNEYTMSANKILRIKFRLRVGSTGNTQWWWLHASGTPANIYVAQGTTANGQARFVLSGTTLYAETSNATAAESTDISSGITVTNMNLYEIVVNGTTSVLYYVNWVLKATHSTRVPTGALSLAFGASAAKQLYISSPIISLQL